MIPNPSAYRLSPDRQVADLFAHRLHGASCVRQRAAFFEFFALDIYPMIAAYRPRLDALYCTDNGRPAIDPVFLLAVLALQFVERLPDRQAAEAVQYDLRWRLALHMSLSDPGFHPSLLAIFRARLLKGGLEGLVFQAVLDRLVEGGWVPKRSKQRLDSTHVCGMLSVMSRLECARETIRLALKDLESPGLLPETWADLWERYVENKLDARCGVESLKAKVLQAGHDMHGMLLWAHSQPPEIQAAESMQLLQRVFDENYELDEQGVWRQTRAQPPGAVHNPHEPQAKWSSKSTIKDKTWIGYKVQVAETLQDEPRALGEPTRNFITAMVTQDAVQSDKAGMAEVLAEQSQMGLELPCDLYVDGAYVCSQTLKDAMDEQRQLHGPAPASPDRGKVFTLESFDVQIENRCAICPSGQRSTNCSRLEAAKTGQVDYRFEWNKTLCSACPLFQQCVSEKQTHRSFLVTEHYGLLQQRRRHMQTEEYKTDMRRRNGIEATQSELVRAHGLRRARYRGKLKARLQNYLIGAACNMRRLFRRIAWERKQAALKAIVMPSAEAEI
jgi:transposase